MSINIKPMLATIDNNFSLDNPNYIYEPKLDGFRAFCIKSNNKITLISRNGNDLTSMFPELKFAEQISADSCILDGEIIIYDDQGMPSFNLMQQRQQYKKKISIPATYVAFDILFLENKDLTNLSLLKRKHQLKKIIKITKITNSSNKLQLSYYTSKGQQLLLLMQKMHMEGVVAKLKTGKYIQARSSQWKKIKFEKTVDCIIIGYTAKNRYLSSLALGLYKKTQIKNQIIYIGKVGTGFTEQLLKQISQLIFPLQKNNTQIFSKDPDAKNIHWISPEIVCEVKYAQFTATKRLRAPVFLRIRADKNPEDCNYDQL